MGNLILTPCCNAAPKILKSKIQTDNALYFAVACPSNDEDDCPESVGQTHWYTDLDSAVNAWNNREFWD